MLKKKSIVKDMPPRNSKKPCATTHVRNPASGRCVLISGKIGAKILFAENLAQVPAALSRAARGSRSVGWVSDRRIQQIAAQVHPQHSFGPATRRLVVSLLAPVAALIGTAPRSVEDLEALARQTLHPDLARYALAEAAKPITPVLKLKSAPRAMPAEVRRAATLALEFLVVDVIQAAGARAMQMSAWRVTPDIVLVALNRDPALRTLLQAPPVSKRLARLTA